MSAIKQILFLLISIVLVTSCSAIQNAIKDVAQDVGQEMSDKVDDKIEDKLSSATDDLNQKLADIDALKDELKSELDAAIADLRDELTSQLTDVSTELSLSNSLPAEITEQMDKVSLAVQSIDSIEDLEVFFSESEVLDSLISSLDPALQNQINLAMQTIYATLNAYDIWEFQDALDIKIMEMEAFIGGRDFKLKEQFMELLAAAHESILALVGLKDIVMANKTLNSAKEIMKNLQSEEDWRSALFEISRINPTLVTEDAEDSEMPDPSSGPVEDDNASSAENDSNSNPPVQEPQASVEVPPPVDATENVRVTDQVSNHEGKIHYTPGPFMPRPQRLKPAYKISFERRKP